MRITMMAFGSRGDVQPYIALGKGLQQAGHTVHFLTHDNFAPLVTAHGLEFWPARGDVQEVAQSEEMRRLLEKGNFIAISKYTAQEAKRVAVYWAQDALAACQGMELIVAGIGGLFMGISLAEKLGLPLIQAHYVPLTPTKAFPGALMPPPVPKLGGSFNKLTHHLTRQVMWQGSRPADNLARQKELGLPKTPFFGPYRADCLQNQPILYGYSTAVIAPPIDWADDRHVTGYWFLDAEDDWLPPPTFTAFLEAGPPPVYIGFGSMGNRDPQQTCALIIEAVRQSGQRAILQSGWDGWKQAEVPEFIFVIGDAPHTWLFDHVAAVVHHGGAGTTAVGLRAGVPSIVVPYFADQPFWGQRVADLGVGPSPIPRKKLTAVALSQAIQQAVTDQTMRHKAAELGVTIRAEDGIARTVAIIEQTVGNRRG